MSHDDWTGVIFGMGVLILGTIILLTVLTQAGKFLTARRERAADDRISEELAGINARLGEIERLLRDVG